MPAPGNLRKHSPAVTTYDIEWEGEAPSEPSSWHGLPARGPGGTRGSDGASPSRFAFPRYSSVESTTASDDGVSVYRTAVSPSIALSRSAATFLTGPGDSALPGSGCGNAVERAV